MAVAGQAFLVTPGLGQRLAKGDADILDRMMRVDVQVALGVDVDVDPAMTGDLVKHVIEKGHAGSKFALAGAIEIETHSDLRLQRVACNFGLPQGLRLQKAFNGGPLYHFALLLRL